MIAIISGISGGTINYQRGEFLFSPRTNPMIPSLSGATI
jgi:hypothetical protein